MAELQPYDGSQLVWKKGSRYWGRALPYLRTEADGKQYVMYSDHWSAKRVEQLTDYLDICERTLRTKLGNDEQLWRLAEARIRTQTQGTLAIKEMLRGWTPTGDLVKAVEACAQRMIRDREWIRGLLATVADVCRKNNGPGTQGHVDLWDASTMAACAVRLPMILDRCCAINLCEHPPAGLQPDHKVSK